MSTPRERAEDQRRLKLEAIEQQVRDGSLTSAALMAGGPSRAARMFTDDVPQGFDGEPVRRPMSRLGRRPVCVIFDFRDGSAILSHAAVTSFRLREGGPDGRRRHAHRLEW